MPTNTSENIDANFSKEYQLLFQNKHPDPHRFLGLHTENQNTVIRLWRPGVQDVEVEVFGKKMRAKEELDGLFILRVAKDIKPTDYRIVHPNGMHSFDPYAFDSVFGEMDCHFLNKGVHYHLYNVLGSRPIKYKGVQGTAFAVWAPNAKRVSLIAGYNKWNSRYQPMRRLESGVFEIFIPGVQQGETYKFEVEGEDGVIRKKADPFAKQSELRPKTASIVTDLQAFSWSDESWIEKQKKRGEAYPMNIYEVHLGSWKQTEAEFRNYRDLAHALCEYCLDMGYTHIELLPIMEHPLDESWGYQVTGFFSATSRYGTPQDFQYFVDHMHKNNIGVFLDWVPGHFPSDEFALAQFDGTSLYEYADPQKGFHPHWNTLIFDYEKPEVANFLIASALFWLDMFHIDGIRVDAVASLLYLDYGREPGEWVPNKFGGNHNLEAIEFIKHLNTIVHERYPYVLMMAEESTAFVGVTKSVQDKGLGFDLKWNMGWMNDTLHFFSKEPEYRHHHMRDLTFGFSYVFLENFLSVLSHDEVVHEKRSLIEKMPGNDWEKFANLRVLLSIALSHPGKGLLFMGGDIAQRTEWNCKGQVAWELLNEPAHRKHHGYMRELHFFYRKHEALWALAFSEKGFQWLDFRDEKNCVISYLRKSENKHLVCVHHFKADRVENYFIKLSNLAHVKEVFNSDDQKYGGTHAVNPEITWDKRGFSFQLAPLATQFFEVSYVEKNH